MERSVTDLAKYRFECCQEALEDARIMYEAGRYKNALNRAYYSIFHGMRAVNALDGYGSNVVFIAFLLEKQRSTRTWKSRQAG